MSEPGKHRREILAKLDKLRLLVAQEIICNRLNTNDQQSHISADAANNELYNQYCLKLFLLWLATKYGFPQYKTSIRSAFQAGDSAGLATPGEWPIFAERYPFYSFFDRDVEQQLRAAAFAFLDTEFIDKNFIDRASTDEKPADKQDGRPPLELAGQLYMQTMQSSIECDERGRVRMVGRAGKRQQGEFYTPPSVVDLCLADNADTDPTGVIDPACGTGNFLLGLLRRSKDPVALCKRLHGRDIDPRAIAIARVLLMLSAASPTSQGTVGDEVESLWRVLEANLRVGDATMTDWRETFDLVITNPPYISFGSRNQKSVPDSLQRYFRQEFRPSSEYKIRMHSVFQELCLRLCKPGGTAILLVPDAFLTGAYYSRLREFIIENADIVSLTELPESTFADATAGRWCIARYKKIDGADGPAEVLLRKLADGAEPIEFRLAAKALISPDKMRFRLVFNQMDLAIVSQLERLPRVDSAFKGRTGIRARHGQASIVAAEQVSPAYQRGLTSGSEVRAHEINWAGKWLNIEPTLLFAGGFDKEVIGGAKVLVRQTADRLIGAVDQSGLFHLNNVHSFAPVPLHRADRLQRCAFFAALINSRLWLYLYRMKSREEKRALAQIDIEMVEALPLPAQTEHAQRLYPLIANAILALPNAERTTETLDAVDRLIYEAYGLDEGQIAHIESCLEATQVKALPSSEQAMKVLKSIADAKRI